MEVYPGLVEYYANQVHLQALVHLRALLVVVDCGCLGKKHLCWGTPFFLCLFWWWQVFFPVFLGGTIFEQIPQPMTGKFNNWHPPAKATETQ